MVSYFLEGFSVIANVLSDDPAVFWFLVPIILLWLVMEFYFSEYRREPLGWNSMLGNGVSLVWITIASLRVIDRGDDTVRFWFLLLFLGYGMALMVVAFRHGISQRYTYAIAGPSTLYSLATLAVLWGQANVPMIGPPLAATLLSLGIIVTVFQILRRTVMGISGEVEAIREGRDPRGPRER